MANSYHLRLNKNQHKPKNKESKRNDKVIYSAMLKCIDYLNDRLGDHPSEYELKFKRRISYHDLMKLIQSQRIRNEFDTTYLSRTIIPDGGVILLTKEDDEEFLRIILVSEVKKQGTNEERIAEGKR